ncbi:MFS transporter [Kitasatospora herbaricolor]|uniref:MFS transporter n=1 Tax=Kitasatospora herbaricolor TaxID=68217 RepID=UPI0019CA9FBE|nr:MFS transporter [Kitasatospora herbaricolor]MDQ0313054.1 MFS family permease [Kitasatospora herbaricolor]GGV24495.1 MFS transporter [Kitasatospora herbaricolor]
MAERFDPAGRRVLAVCIAAGFTTLLDQSVLNTSVPALRDSLHAQSAQIQWVVAGFSLAFGLALVPGGRFGDVRGRRTLFITGLAVFTGFSLLSATATHPWTLVAARLLQGAGAGLVNSQMIGTIQDVFTGQQRARALGLYAVTGGLATALGPPVGGLVLAVAGAQDGWRLTFLLNVPFGLLTLFLAARFLPPPRSSTGHPDLDPVGLVLVAALTLVVMVPFVRPPGVPGAVGYLLAAGALTVLFVHWQRRYARAGRHPLVHPALARSRPFALGTVVAMAQFGSSIAAGLVLIMFLQDGLGMSPMGAALVSLPAALAMGLSSALAWRVVRRFGRHTVTAGMALSAVALLAGGLVALRVPAAVLPVVLALVQFCAGIAVGLVNAPNQAAVLRHAPPEAAGVGGAILQMAQRIAAAVGVSALSGVYLRGTSAGDGSGHRTAYFYASATCAAIAAAAVVVSVFAARAAEASPLPVAPGPVAPLPPAPLPFAPKPSPPPPVDHRGPREPATRVPAAGPGRPDGPAPG